MRLLYFLLITVVIAGCESSGMGGSNSDENNSPKVKKIHPGYYQFEYAGIFLEVNPLLAGKITTLNYKGQHILVPRDSSLTNFGSTLWPSPQNLWNVWPPPYNLCQAPYSASFKDGELTMVSETDQQTGLQFSKNVALSKYDSAINLYYEITNNKDNSIKVAPWEITRLYKGGMVIFPGNKLFPETLKKSGWDPPISNYQLSRVESSGYFDQLTKEGNHYWLEVKEKSSPINQLVADGNGGWTAYAKDGYLFIKKFPDVSEEQLPPHHGDVEILFNKDYKHFEIEQHGTYEELAPGESLQWAVKWYVRKIPDHIQVKRNSKPLIRFINSIVAPVS